MRELFRATALLGVKHMLKLGRGYKLGWEEMIRGYFSTRVMHALLNTGVIDEMLSKGSLDVEEFATKNRLDPQILEALCQALYSIRIFEIERGRYTLDRKGRLIVEVLRGWLEVSYGYSEIFDSLEPMLRGEKRYGKDFYRKSDFVARGSGEMENWLFFPIANEIVAESGSTRVLDLGCGDGTFLRKLAKHNPGLTCYGIDLAPSAIEEGRQKATAEGLQDRIHLYAQDICKMQEIPNELKNVDLATTFFVLHEILYHGEEALMNFLHAYQRSFPGIPLVAFEAVRPTAAAMRKKPGIAVYYFAYHDLSNQKPVGPEEWRRLFKQAGFSNVVERPMPFARAAVYILK